MLPAPLLSPQPYKRFSQKQENDAGGQDHHTEYSRYYLPAVGSFCVFLNGKRFQLYPVIRLVYEVVEKQFCRARIQDLVFF
jgi:hypothetical protein